MSERYEEEVPELDPRQALEGSSEPARRLRGLVDPLSLKPSIELEVERWSRTAIAGFFRRELDLPSSTISAPSGTGTQPRLRGAPGSAARARSAAPRGDRQRLARRHGLRPLVVPRHQRAAQLVVAMSAEVAERRFATETAVVLLALDEGRVGFVDHEGGHALPVARGSGEEAARHLLRRVTGSTVGTLSLLGSLPGTEDRDALEVWVARRIRGRRWCQSSAVGDGQ